MKILRRSFDATSKDCAVFWEHGTRDFFPNLWVVTKCTVGAVSDFGPKFSTHVESSILPAKARNWLHVGDLRPRRSHARDRTLSQTFRIQFHYNFHILYITPPSAVAHAMFKDVQISKAQPYLETPHFVHPWCGPRCFEWFIRIPLKSTNLLQAIGSHTMVHTTKC